MSQKPKTFLSGVVEGFYGRPWTMKQRTELFRRELRWGLNTYLYGPKDDRKHRLYWRELYTHEEAELLARLISAARESAVEFIYSISPGLDITYSSPSERNALKNKLQQVRGLGCRSFALLFDDIETEMCPADADVFSSIAHAQVSVTNLIHQQLQPHTFLFCPTDYCAAFCSPSVPLSKYLNTVGETLHADIDVLWTGPKVVSEEISVESVEEVARVLRRPPLIWDNLHANDYDPQRIFLGPYKNRSTQLVPRLRGVLTNPNCEFESNFVAIHTLGTWCRTGLGLEDDTMDGVEDSGSDYNPHDALQLALTDWLVEFGRVDHPDGNEGRDPPASAASLQVATPGPRERRLYAAEALALSDLALLTELFHLPYEHGAAARHMLSELHWLRGHAPPATPQEGEWRRRARGFEEACEGVVRMFDRLSTAPNRSVLYDLYNYICDIKSAVCLARAFVKTLGGHAPHPALALTDDPEPWGFRGGLSGEFQRMLPCHGNRDLFLHPPATRVYTVRPWTPRDQPEVLKTFKRMEAELVSDRLVEGHVTPSEGCGLVLEDSSGVCGYALGLVDAHCALSAAPYPRTLLQEFPSVLALHVHPSLPDHAPAKRLLQQGVSALRDLGSTGVFSEVRADDRRMLDLLRSLQHFQPLQLHGLQDNLLIMATHL